MKNQIEPIATAHGQAEPYESDRLDRAIAACCEMIAGREKELVDLRKRLEMLREIDRDLVRLDRSLKRIQAGPATVIGKPSYHHGEDDLGQPLLPPGPGEVVKEPVQ